MPGAERPADCFHSSGHEPTMCMPITHAPHPSSPDASQHINGISGWLSQKCVEAGTVSLDIALSHHCNCLLRPPRTDISRAPLPRSLPIAANSASLLGRPGMYTWAIHDNMPAIDSNSRNDRLPLTIASRTRAIEYSLCFFVTYMLQSIVLMCTPKKVMPLLGAHGPCVFSLGGMPRAVRIVVALRNERAHSSFVAS